MLPFSHLVLHNLDTFVTAVGFRFLQITTVPLSRLVVPNKGYSSLDQSPDEKPLVALDTDR